MATALATIRTQICVRCRVSRPREEFLYPHRIFPQYGEICATCKAAEAEAKAAKRAQLRKQEITEWRPRQKQEAKWRRVRGERAILREMVGAPEKEVSYRVMIPRNERITIMSANNRVPVLKIETNRKLKTGDIEQMKRVNLTEFAKAFTPEVMRQIGEKVVMMVLTGRNPETNEPIEDKDWKAIASMALQHTLPKPTETIIQEGEGGIRINAGQQFMQALEGRPDILAKMLEVQTMLENQPAAKKVESHIVEQAGEAPKEDAA